MTRTPSILDGIQLRRVAATIGLKGETAIEECLHLASDSARLYALLDGLLPVDRLKALVVFQSVGALWPIQHDNPRAVFCGLIQLALCVPGADVTAWLVTVPYLGQQPNMLVVHHGDKVTPISLVGCRLGPSSYLSYNLPGSELICTLLNRN